MRPGNIELHIEELVLHGFAPKDRYQIGEAVQCELVRLLSERGVLPSVVRGGEMGRLDGGSFKVRMGAKAEVIGVQVARAVYGGMKR